MIPGSAIPLLLATAGPTFNPRDYFDVKLYTGNGSTQTISGLNFSPDFAWFKSRSAAENHVLSDRVRGADRQLFSNLTNAEQTNSTYVTSFTDDGFSLGSNTGTGGNNINGSTYAAWCWDAGTSTVTNTAGSITSQVRANASAGFSVATFNSGSSGNKSFGHGLNVAPSLVLIKNRTSTASWITFHRSAITNVNDFLRLESTVAIETGTDVWGTSLPDSSLIYFSSTNTVAPNDDCVCYAFAPVSGYSSFGSYTGNGSATGPVISGLGFQPYFVMIKASSTTGDWWMYDGARSPSNPRINKLKANTSDAEDTAGEDVDFQLDGFQIKTSDSGLNQNAATYIYAAFA